MKVGIIRCRQTEDYCPSTNDLKFAKEKRGAFESIEGEAEVIAIISCGGCPGKRAVLRAKEMVKRGVEAIFFATCIKKGTPIGFPCPSFELMKTAVQNAVGSEIKVYEHTH